jgi:excisionase family DNA binding protein
MEVPTMQAYAPAERLGLAGQLPSVEPTSPAPLRRSSVSTESDSALINQLLGLLADLVVDRLMKRTEAGSNPPADEWMDARAAAAYLGIHRDTLRKLSAERAVPVHQDGPGCKLYFHRDELDEWRRTAKAPRSRLRAVS